MPLHRAGKFEYFNVDTSAARSPKRTRAGHGPERRARLSRRRAPLLVKPGLIQGLSDRRRMLDDVPPFDRPYWLRSSDDVQVRTYANAPAKTIYLTGGYKAIFGASACLNGEDDGVVQYASIYACNGSATASYDNTNVCGNTSKQESSGFRNLDASHENHERSATPATPTPARPSRAATGPAAARFFLGRFYIGAGLVVDKPRFCVFEGRADFPGSGTCTARRLAPARSGCSTGAATPSRTSGCTSGEALGVGPSPLPRAAVETSTSGTCWPPTTSPSPGGASRGRAGSWPVICRMVL